MKQNRDTQFKEIHRFQKDNDLCMKCGFCLSACPIYKEELVESSAARGRNALVKGLLKGEINLTAELAERIEKCTLCKTCTVNCPTGVDTPAVVIAARADSFRRRGIGFPYNLVYRHILPHRVLFGRTVKAARLVQRICFPQDEGTLRHLPQFLSAMGKGRHIPEVAPRFFRQIVPVINKPPAEVPIKVRIGYMTGCMTDFIFPESGLKIVNFLTRHGVEVIIPREQGCCGAPVFLGSGDFDTGRKMADINVKAFQDLDYVIVDCATCGSSIKDYVKYLTDNPERKTAYQQLGNKIIHITAFLVNVLKLPPEAYQAIPEIKGKTVTWHDPCHLNRYMGIKSQPRQILKNLSDIKYVEMDEAERCCGMAGGFSLHHYELSSRIVDKKIKSIIKAGADVLVTGCPGCQIQFTDAIARYNLPIKVMHIMDILE